jgi:hypothetical protein
MNSIFEVYESEKTKIIENYKSLVKKVGDQEPNQSTRFIEDSLKVKSTLTWRLQNLNLKQNFYKDSDPFFHEGVFWNLYV